MPCATVHLLLADRVLRHWDTMPEMAPVPSRHPEVRRAFLHGALAPDMGFVPGVDRFISELAHYHRPADFTRALLRASASPLDEAFAWGWATHVEGDVAIHPIVGRAVGEHLHGDRSRRVDAVENVAAHVSLEVGLDICVLQNHQSTPRPPSVPCSDAARVAQVGAALMEVYGLRWDRSQLAREHRQAVRLTRFWPRVLRLLAARWTGAHAPLSERVRTGLALRMANRMGSMAGLETAARGFFQPRLPPDWMMREVEAVVGVFAERFQYRVDDGMDGLENRNLETGEMAGPGRGHAASDAVARRLDALVSRRLHVTR